MSNRHQKKKQPTKPFCLRLTENERFELEQHSGQMALGSYIKSCLFDKKPPSRSRSSQTDHKALAALLAWFGQSNIAANIRFFAHAARNGSLPLSPETTAKLEQACKDISAIKSALMKALGIKER